MKKHKPSRSLTPAVFTAGICIMAAGFALLFFVDQRAQNVFGLLAPLFIVCGIITMAVSFLFK